MISLFFPGSHGGQPISQTLVGNNWRHKDKGETIDSMFINLGHHNSHGNQIQLRGSWYIEEWLVKEETSQKEQIAFCFPCDPSLSFASFC